MMIMPQVSLGKTAKQNLNLLRCATPDAQEEQALKSLQGFQRVGAHHVLKKLQDCTKL